MSQEKDMLQMVTTSDVVRRALEKSGFSIDCPPSTSEEKKFFIGFLREELNSAIENNNHFPGGKEIEIIRTVEEWGSFILGFMEGKKEGRREVEKTEGKTLLEKVTAVFDTS